MLKHQTYKYDQEFHLELGDSLPELELYYTTYGKLNENRSNVVWVCHASREIRITRIGGRDFLERDCCLIRMSFLLFV